MMPDDDTTDRALASIAVLEPDGERASRLRERCRSLIERRAPTGAATAAAVDGVAAPSATQVSARHALVGLCSVLCLVYVLSLVLTAVRLQSIWR